jgi:hypothetical protein
MENPSFSRCWAYPVGAGIGALLGLQAGASIEFIIGGAILGLLAGGLIFLLDPRKGNFSGEKEDADEEEPARRANGTLMSRLFATLAVGLFWMPILGLALGVGAVLMNFKTRGWPRVLGWIGAILGAVVTGFFFMLK